MKFTSIKTQKPLKNKWYLVKCPEYCESGYLIAKWNGENWEHEFPTEDINRYVTGFYNKPLN